MRKLKIVQKVAKVSYSSEFCLNIVVHKPILVAQLYSQNTSANQDVMIYFYSGRQLFLSIFSSFLIDYVNGENT